MRSLRLLLAVVFCACAVPLLAFFPHTAAAVVTEMNLTLETGPQPMFGATATNAVPGNCSVWHELYPNYCAPHHQTNYEDNGDGVVSVCDFIYLDGVCFHIDWVGPTYYMTRLTPAPQVQGAAEPVTTNSGEDPVCETWHWVWPNYCDEFHVDSWYDNGNHILDPCDEIDHVLQTGVTEVWHIDRIALNIKVSLGPTESRPSTWGRLKTLYR